MQDRRDRRILRSAMPTTEKEDAFSASSFISYEQNGKPGSVFDSHLSRHTVANVLKPPPEDGRASHLSSPRRCSGESLQRCAVPRHRVSPYLAFPPLPSQQNRDGKIGKPFRWGIASAAVEDRVQTTGLVAPLSHVLPRDAKRHNLYQHGFAAMAVYLCCTCPGVAPGGCYPLSLPCGARTFLTASLSKARRGCLSYSYHLLYKTPSPLSRTVAIRGKMAYNTI